ncbi:MAG: low temperature requirement protein A, partial [Litorimonas sp.]
AKADPDRRATATRYAAGIALAQLFWVSLLFLPPLGLTAFLALFGLGVLIELAVPAIAERKANTPWHRHHIIERYGLLTIIVLGEVLLATFMALKGAFTSGVDWALIEIAVASLVVMAAMWWLYFCDEDHLDGTELGNALTWGYGHFVVFGAAAAVGAGFAVMVDVAADHAEIGRDVALASVGIPLALYIAALWLIRDRRILNGVAGMVLLPFSVLVLAATLLGLGVWSLAALSVLCVVLRNGLARR